MAVVAVDPHAKALLVHRLPVIKLGRRWRVQRCLVITSP
jgi:hypothetical protein